MRKLHDGLSDLLLFNRGGLHRPFGRKGRAVEAVGFLLHGRLYQGCRREHPPDDAVKIQAVADAQVLLLGGSIRRGWVRWLRALHHVVSSRHRHHEELSALRAL